MCVGPYQPISSEDLHPDNLQLHFFLGLGTMLLCCSFFCPLDQPCKMLQTVQVTPISKIYPGSVYSTTQLCKAIKLLLSIEYLIYCFEFRIRITDTIEYSSHTEEKTNPAVTDLPLKPPVHEKKPILMVKVENVLHEPFKLTEEVKVRSHDDAMFMR